MTLEAAIAEQTKALGILTEAMNKSNDLAERMIGLKTEAIETVKATAAPADAKPKATTTAKATETKADPAPTAEKPAEKPMDPIAEAISGYVGDGYDTAHAQAADERKARAAKVKDIFAAIAGKAGVSVTKHTEIPEAYHGAFLKTLAKRVEEGCLVIGHAAEGGDDDLLGN